MATKFPDFSLVSSLVAGDVFVGHNAASSGEQRITAQDTAAGLATLINPTWDNALTVFRGIDMNVTNTASDAASQLMRLRIGGSEKAAIGLSGQYSIGGVQQLAASAATLTLGAASLTQIEIPSTVNLGIGVTPTYPLDVAASSGTFLATFEHNISAGAGGIEYQNLAAVDAANTFNFDFNLKTTVQTRTVGRMLAGLSDTTDATRQGFLSLYATGNSALIERLRVDDRVKALGTSETDGSAPVTLQIRDARSSASWTTDADFGALDFYSEDVSAAEEMARISAIMTNAAGSQAGLKFYINGGAGVIPGMQLYSDGSLRMFDSFFELKEASAPTGDTDKARIFCEDNGSGKTRLMVQFPTGAAQQIAIEP